VFCVVTREGFVLGGQRGDRPKGRKDEVIKPDGRGNSSGVSLAGLEGCVEKSIKRRT